jgi:magnesium transporter
VLIDCAVYRDGKRVLDHEHKTDVAAAHADAESGGGFLWIGLYEPTKPELEQIAAELDLHRLAVEDAVKAHQRPKIERYGEQLIFVVLKTLRYVDSADAVESGEISIFVSSRYIVTVRHGVGSGLEDVRHWAEEELSILGNGPAAALYAIVDEVVDRYEQVAAELETDVEEIERSVFSPDRTHDSERIYGLKRETLEVRRAVLPLRGPLAQFVHKDAESLSAAAMPFFRDVADHLARVADTVDYIDALLDSALSAHLARLSVQQNEDTRKISAWGALLLVPTLVAGIYGMNFEIMPELEWSFGYPLTLLIMLTLSYGLYRAFKRSGWL